MDNSYLNDARKLEADLTAFMQDIIHGWTRERTVDEIVEVASLMRIPVAPVGNGETLPEMDHLVARGVFVRNPAGFLQPRVPYRLEVEATRNLPTPCSLQSSSRLSVPVVLVSK